MVKVKVIATVIWSKLTKNTEVSVIVFKLEVAEIESSQHLKISNLRPETIVQIQIQTQTQKENENTNRNTKAHRWQEWGHH